MEQKSSAFYEPKKLSKILIVLQCLFFISCGSETSENSSSISSNSSSSQIQSSSSSSSSEAKASLTIQENSSGLCQHSGPISENEHTGFTGQGYLNTDNTAGASIIWQINSPTSDYFDITIRFANGGSTSRTAELSVDGGASEHFTFIAGAWDNWQNEAINVYLEQGVQTITLTPDTASGLPNIDSITIAGANFSTAACENLPSPPVVVTPPVDSSECFAGASITNKTVDCGGKTIGLSCVGDSESQPAVLTLNNATVKNVRIAANGGSDGIHCVGGDCVLENVVWEDICEDAATLKNSGSSLTIIGGSAYNDNNGPGGKADKIFQHNNRNSTIMVTGGFTTYGHNGKLWRSCGNCSNNGGPRHLIVDDVVIDGTIGAIAGANGNYGDTVTINNLRIRNYSPGSPHVCDEYVGVDKSTGQSSTKLGERWDTNVCKVSRSDVTAL